MKFIKTFSKDNFLWFTWGKKCRWISFECHAIQWRPAKESYAYGFIFSWLFFAVGTGVVSRYVMNLMINNSLLGR